LVLQDGGFQFICKYTFLYRRHTLSIDRLKVRHAAAKHYYVRVKHIDQIRQRPAKMAKEISHESHRFYAAGIVVVHDILERTPGAKFLRIELLSKPVRGEIAPGVPIPKVVGCPGTSATNSSCSDFTPARMCW